MKRSGLRYRAAVEDQKQNASAKRNSSFNEKTREMARKLPIVGSEARKRKPPESIQKIVGELEHYASKLPRKTPTDFNSCSKLIEYASSTDSDDEDGSQNWNFIDGNGSDAESITGDQSPLRYAGTFAPEEVVLMARDKLIRLQSLYIDQFRVLQHELRESRRDYLAQATREQRDREDAGSSHLASQLTPAEAHDEKMTLRAMKRYHYPHGNEAILHYKSKQLAKSTTVSHSPKPTGVASTQAPKSTMPKSATSAHASKLPSRCVHFSAAAGRCGHKTLPLARFCPLHIVDDQRQVLYKRCTFDKSACERPVCQTTSQSLCRMHTSPVPFPYRLPKKQDEQKESAIEPASS